MRILESWLRRYLSFRIPPEKLAESLSMLGLEIERIERLGEKYNGFLVGQVLGRAPHPNADRLTVCSVATGRETLQIVCGAPNVAPGQKVAVGLVGATIPQNQHDPSGNPFVLTRATIRGVESAGMICSEYELGLGKDAEGILVLDEGARVGQPLAEYLGMDDVAYDIEITPNRPDWLSHLGVAREIGVLTKKKPVLPGIRLREGKVPITKQLSVTVQDRENCFRFAARMIRGVRIGPSPAWLQNLLRNAGLRPRNNVVDVTNFVMLECGHPMHAFDYSLLRGHRIVVRQAKEGTPFFTLDGKEHMLPGRAVMVCDGEREVSIAGVMGGLNSEIRDDTTDVVLESAYWNPSSIRRTSKALGIVSDASQRFERGADPGMVLYALDRAAQLVVELAGGEILKGTLDVRPRKTRVRVVPLRTSRVNSVLGTRLTVAQIVRYLDLLQISRVGRSRDPLRFRVPTYRVDIEREIDLIEEVARVHGYDRIEERTTATIDFSRPLTGSGISGRVRSALIGAGFQEAITNSMQNEQRSGLSGKEAVTILNPQNQEMATLRTSLVPGLLDAVALNQSFGTSTLRLFEIGHTFSVDNSAKPKLVGNFLEEEKVSVLITGLSRPRSWSEPARAVDLFDMKGELELLLEEMGLDKGQFISYSTSNGLTDNTLAIDIHGSYAGYLGRIKDDVLKPFGIEQEVFAAELSLQLLEGSHTTVYSPLPRFPKVKRDVAFVVDASISVSEMEKAIRDAAGELLSSVELFDVYRGENLGEGKRGLAFSLELLSREKTLTDKEIEAAVQNVVRGVGQATGATIRGE